MAERIRILVVDDSVTVRKHLVETIASSPDMEVVGEAGDGERAIALCRALRPDLMTLDLVLPKLDGVAVTEQVMAYAPTPILVVSAASNRADLFHTYDALAAGAVDVLDKPDAGHDMTAWKRRFLASVRLVARIPVITHPRARLRPSSEPLRREPPRRGGPRPRAVVIGASTGGPAAVLSVLSRLPPSFPLPILVVIHIGPAFGDSLAQWLDGAVSLQVREARGGEPLPDRGRCAVFLAPPGRHLEVGDGRLRLSDGAERHSCRPSVDVLFESAARHLGAEVIGCLLTGMGRDGAQGLLAISHAGGATIAQDEQSSVVFGMPGEAVRLGAAHQILSLSQVPGALDRLARVGSTEEPSS